MILLLVISELRIKQMEVGSKRIYDLKINLVHVGNSNLIVNSKIIQVLINNKLIVLEEITIDEIVMN